MASTAPIDFAPMMGAVARRLLGEPNKALSSARTLRWGTNGSLKVDLDPGAFHDKEANTGGGVLDLIMREQRCDKRGAIEWLEREQFIDPQAAARSPGPARIFYDYADADGQIAYRVERRGKGQFPPFLQHGPDGRGGFHAGKGCMQGVPRLPYRLPDLIAADPTQPIFIVEGEKDADRLTAVGMIATTNSEGAGKFRDELVPHFAGRRVIVIPDNDQPGKDHAADIAKKLTGVAAAIAILPLPGLPAKGDVSDWLAQGGSAFELRRLAADALDRPDETFALADLSQWAVTTPTPKAFVMAPFIPREDVVIVTGDGGSNKSTLALQLSACAAAGKAMLGMDVAPSPALYVTAEDDDRENHWRLFKIAATIGTTIGQLAPRLHVVSLRGRLNNELATFDHDGKLQPAPAYRMLRATIQRTGAKIVTLDNVAHLFAGNENDRSQVTAFINLLYQLCGDLGVTILLIAHRNKVGDSYSGSTAWLNAVRSQVLLERGEDTDPDSRSLSLGKANYARPGERVDFRWHDFALVRDCDLADDQRREMAAVVRAAGDNAAFMACLEERNKQRRQTSEKPTAANYAPKQFEGMREAKGLTRKRLEAAMERLFATREIERGFLYRDTSEGKDIVGLRKASPTQPETSPETSRKQLPEGTGNPQKSTGNTHPISKDIPGAANRAAAPDPKKNEESGSRAIFTADYPNGRPRPAPILAPGEKPDDPVPGLDW